jgi:bacteriocin-like protein
MKNFEELSFEEMQEVEGGYRLWRHSIVTSKVFEICVEFYEGLKEGFDDGKKLK